jgi:transcriptional regulator with GAF, ATPase, and Fis domain
VPEPAVASPQELDRLLTQAVDALEAVVPYELAAVFELDGDRLRVRVARGPLVNDAVLAHSLELAAFPTVRRSLESRQPIALREHDHDGEGDPYDGVLDLPHGHSCMVVPLFAGERTLGAMTFDRTVCEPYPEDRVRLAGVYGRLLGLAFLMAEQAQGLDRARRALAEQNRLLLDEAGRGGALQRLANTRVPAMRLLVERIRQVGPTGAPVLIEGATGVGKELVAQALHDTSERRERAFVKLNCAALPENLLESELFGHVRGAFSGATNARAGRFSTADRGTLLLDEVAELPAGAQAKLLRVLQEGTFEPVGSDRTVRVDVRIVAATHVRLEQAVAEGRFREDLYYRLAVFPLAVPPLGERLDDLPALAEAILTDLAHGTGRGPWWLGEAAQARLRAHPWPGNVRQLANTLERATIVEVAGELQLADLGLAVPPPAATAVDLRPLDEVQRSHIEAVLRHTGGRISGPGGAAELLGLKPTTLRSRMERLGVRRVP